MTCLVAACFAASFHIVPFVVFSACHLANGSITCDTLRGAIGGFLHPHLSLHSICNMQLGLSTTYSHHCCLCQGMTSFPLQSHLGVFPTLTSDTFSIPQTLTASQFQKHFRVLPTPSPFQQSPTLPHAPSTPTPHLIPPPKAAPRPLPPPKVTWRPPPTPHPPIWTLL